MNIEDVLAFLEEVRLGTPTRCERTNHIVFNRQRGVTPIWYQKVNGEWQWTPDLSNWLSVPNLVVESGIFAGHEPALCNIIIILALSQQNGDGHFLPLHAAITFAKQSVFGRLGPRRDVIQALARCKSFDVNLTDSDCNTAVALAARRGELAILGALLSHSDTRFYANCDGQTALHAAVSGDSPAALQITQLLLEQAAKQLKATLRAALPLFLALKELPVLLQVVIMDELLPSTLTEHQKWLIASRCKHFGESDRCFADAAELGRRDRLGRTALLLAFTNDKATLDLRLLLLRAATKRVIATADNSGQTALLLARAKGDEETVAKFL